MSRRLAVSRELLSRTEERLRKTLEKIVLDSEERLLLALKQAIETDYYVVGVALKEIREKRLYRSTHDTMHAYCMETFGFGYRIAWRKIACAEIADEMSPAGDISDGVPLLSESQARALIPLKTPQERREVYEEARAETPNGKGPTRDRIEELAGMKKLQAMTPQEQFDTVNASAKARTEKVQRLDDRDALKKLAKYGRKAQQCRDFCTARGLHRIAASSDQLVEDIKDLLGPELSAKERLR